MKISRSWLNEYITIDMPDEEMAHGLTMAGLEVDTVTDRFDYLDAYIVGNVLDTAAHPNADRLRICTVDTGDGTRTIICGAPNVDKGQFVPVALPETVLLNGATLREAAIRGVTSHGMIMSEAELGIGPDQDGILVLSGEHTPGGSLKNALRLSDSVIEIDLTPNRGDCLSILGVAREVGALTGLHARPPEVNYPEDTGDIRNFVSVTIEAPDLCPRYTAALLTDVKVGPSPFRLRDRLTSVGLRPINNIVDITNFVMMEMGQPLHAFDFDRLSDDHRIVVKTADEGESFTTLDGGEHRLTADTLMICDGNKPVAIGGVMGGLNSEIEPETTRVLLESANFNPACIRKTAKRFGLHSDASHRFERGVDPRGAVRALKRAAELIAEVSGATIISGIIDEYPGEKKIDPIRLNIDKTNRVLGTSLTKGYAAELLRRIEFDVLDEDDKILTVTAPSFRFDISRPEDLMEEIARLSGYDHIPITTPAGGQYIREKNTGTLPLKNRVKELMAGLGFSEAVTYSFNHSRACDDLGLDEKDLRRRQTRIANPLTDDMTVMRSSLIPGLLAVAKHNFSQQIKTLRIFEAGKVFMGKTGEGLPEETEFLAGFRTGGRHPASWHDKETVSCDYYDLKGVVESLLHSLGIFRIDFLPLDDVRFPYYKKGYAAQIRVNDHFIGVLGELASSVRSRWELEQPVVFFELNLDRLKGLVSDAVQAGPVPRYPATSRDATLIVDRALHTAELLEAVDLEIDSKVDSDADDIVESVELINIYTGPHVAGDKKSVSFRIIYRSGEGTLEDEHVNQVHRQLCNRLIRTFNALLPGASASA